MGDFFTAIMAGKAVNDAGENLELSKRRELNEQKYNNRPGYYFQLKLHDEKINNIIREFISRAIETIFSMSKKLYMPFIDMSEPLDYEHTKAIVTWYEIVNTHRYLTKIMPNKWHLQNLKKYNNKQNYLEGYDTINLIPKTNQNVDTFNEVINRLGFDGIFDAIQTGENINIKLRPITDEKYNEIHAKFAKMHGGGKKRAKSTKSKSIKKPVKKTANPKTSKRS